MSAISFSSAASACLSFLLSFFAATVSSSPGGSFSEDHLEIPAVSAIPEIPALPEAPERPEIPEITPFPSILARFLGQFSGFFEVA